MIVLDVCLGLTKTEVGKVLDQNVCHVFAPDRSSLQKSKASLLLEERVPLFHWDCGQRPAWGWWWNRWQLGRTGPCLPSSRQSQHLPSVESSESESGEKEFPTSSSADKSDCGAGARVDVVAMSLPPSWRRSGSRGVVVGRRGPRVTGAKRSAMFFQRALTRPMFPKKAPRTNQ